MPSSISRTKGRHWSAVVMLACAVFLVALMTRPVPTVDGAVRASLARNIIESGQWYPLTYQGQVFIDHPPFYVWLVALSFKAFGVNDFAANLPMHLCAFLTVIITYLLARRSRLNPGVALMAALILCSTRDFVLSSVRGYIEPLVEVCVYGAFYCAVSAIGSPKRLTSAFYTVMTAVLVAGGWFAKGPPALWPSLFFMGFFLWPWPRPFESTKRQRLSTTAIYTFTCLAIAAAAAAVFTQPSIRPYFDEYFYKQILGSALHGRDHAQGFEPFYFISILKQYYWPWLPFLLFGLWRCVFPGPVDALRNLNPSLPPWAFALFALGYVAGFSLMKWKFWYYIAPAYPAFALVIAATVFRKIEGWLARPAFARLVLGGSVIWIVIAGSFPVPLFRDRVPEVTAFANTIRNSSIPGPVWFLHNPADHNMIATSGEWSFGGREVRKVHDEVSWSGELERSLKSHWIITGSEFWDDLQNRCKYSWCRRAHLIQRMGRSVLVLWIPLRINAAQ